MNGAKNEASIKASNRRRRVSSTVDIEALTDAAVARHLADGQIDLGRIHRSETVGRRAAGGAIDRWRGPSCIQPQTLQRNIDVAPPE